MGNGKWLHMDVYTTETHLLEGAFGKGERGAQYVGPYPLCAQDMQLLISSTVSSEL